MQLEKKLMKKFYKRTLLSFAVLILSHFSFSQKSDSTNFIDHFSGAVSVTNNGISVIPTFTLGKPAAIFNFSVGTRKLSFEPELKFSLEGKPWGFIFWWRYKLLNTEKFRLNVGAHPAITYTTVPAVADGLSKENETLVAKHFAAAELSPVYLLSKNFSIGIYYLYAYGFESDVTKNTNFIIINTSLSNIKLSNQFFMRFTPQFYYLKLDGNDGIYFTSSLMLSKKNLPLTLSAVINKAIKTGIQSEDFVWNATLTYAFSKKYGKQ